MIVHINKRELVVFQGARLGDVVRIYSRRSLHMVMNGHYAVFDRFGNLTELDGPVRQGQIFTIKRIKFNS